MTTILDKLVRLGACAEAIEWAKTKPDAEAIIRDCKRSDWLIWLDNRMNILTDSERRLLACWFVRNTPLADGRKVWDLLTDERSRNAVEVAERHACGDASDEELDAARDAARDWARDAARAAAWAAAWAAARAAARAAAWNAAWGAARDAAWAVQARHIIDTYGDRFIAKLNA